LPAAISQRVANRLAAAFARRDPTLKTMSYAVMHFTVAVAVTFALTGSWVAALSIGIIEPAVQTVAFNLHERAWSRRRAAPVRA
jgi:uncharacterized membrane protein